MTRSEKVALAALTFIPFSYIISSAYLGVNGAHIFRQSDVYGHILGFIGTKGFSEYDRFIMGTRRVFDIPIYQFVIAKVSLLIHSDPLVVTRFINVFLWLLTAYSGYRLVRSLGEALAGTTYIFLLATSPLILHYFSVPLPDLMAIAFSMLGITLLHIKGANWPSILSALPFLATATLIKSPVPFVFILFYASYTALNIHIKELSTRKFIANNVPLITILITVLVFAIFAEQLRIILLDGGGGVFVQNPNWKWYFGTWDLRFSDGFWEIIWQRFNIAGPFAFGFIYVLVVVIANIIRPEKKHLFTTISALTAFFGGWLVFSNVYEVHDYYQLPGTVIIFLSFAISFSYLADTLLSKVSDRTRNISYAAVFVTLIPFAFLQVLTQESLSIKSRANLYSGVEYALRNQSVFLFVTDNRGRDPSMGGRLSTKYKKIIPKEFENKCTDYLNSYSGILVQGSSGCLTRNKHLAKYFIEENGITFFLDNR